MGAQNFNFVPKFSQDRGLSAPNFAFFGRKFSDETKIFRQFSDSQNLAGEAIVQTGPTMSTLATPYYNVQSCVPVQHLHCVRGKSNPLYAFS